MKIRSAEEKDFQTVKDITVTTISCLYPLYYPSGAVRFFLNHHSDERIRQDIRDGKVYLLESCCRYIGTVTISGNEVGRLFVLPECQHQGYGSFLMDFAEESIRKQSDVIVLDASLSAKGMYLKRGYVTTAYHTIRTDNGDYLCYDVMEKHAGSRRAYEAGQELN